MANLYKVFISHSWDYVNDLNNLRNLLEQRGYFKTFFQEASPNEPINSVNTEYIKRVLRLKIAESNIILGIAGMYASHSTWMDWELQTAVNHNIPIVGVIPRGQEKISLVVSSRSKENVYWNTESIVAAIRKHAI
ncbi:TIR domain-containing protein [Geovibrio ferrireducens]|uniref:TIR domain-containing protein n=1 Tax=Geovibrio ferrireducens TaxID=46201 RepID=UPI0022468A59|nr:TIR domain-containing protein [Geovibrio ferrireducens]